jgi:hypothetical protein
VKSTPEYFAVPDPTDPQRMTYWRQTDQRFTAWPARARYGPRLLKSDVPAELTGRARQEWIWKWAADHLNPWFAAVRTAIADDPNGCAARFAALSTRCCWCGRVLKDAASKTYGVGPECRDGWPAEVLAAMVAAVGREHAAAIAAALRG